MTVDLIKILVAGNYELFQMFIVVLNLVQKQRMSMNWPVGRWRILSMQVILERLFSPEMLLKQSIWWLTLGGSLT